jgi:hypothetical protein
MSAHQKPAALLRLMAERQGQRITTRDVAALQLAVRTMEEQATRLDRELIAYRDTLHELVIHKVRADALQDGVRALLEIHA